MVEQQIQSRWMLSEDYPEDWATRAYQVKKRDEFTCQNCGIQGYSKGDAELHAHHIVPVKKGGTHEFENLQTLCKDCHDAIHHRNKLAPTANSSRKYKDVNQSRATNINNNSDEFISILMATVKYSYLLLIKWPMIICWKIFVWTLYFLKRIL